MMTIITHVLHKFSCFLWRIILLYPKRRSLPIELSTLFQINAANTDNSKRNIYCSGKRFLQLSEGCTMLPHEMRINFNAAVVEKSMLESSCWKWNIPTCTKTGFQENKNGKGGMFSILWTQSAEFAQGIHLKSHDSSWNGSAVTWKYPFLILKGRLLNRWFYSVAVTTTISNWYGTKWIHIGKTKSKNRIQKDLAGKSQILTEAQVKYMTCNKMHETSLMWLL